MHRSLGDIDAVEAERAAGRHLEPGEEAREGRFAGSGFADDREHFAAPHLEVEPVVGANHTAAERIEARELVGLDDRLAVRARDVRGGRGGRDKKSAFPGAHATRPMPRPDIGERDRAGVARFGQVQRAARAEGAAARALALRRHRARDRYQGALALADSHPRNRPMSPSV